jgi:hypothetical protein
VPVGVVLFVCNDRAILGASQSLLASGACNAAAVLLVALYLQDDRASPLLTGLCLIPQPAGRRPLERLCVGGSGLEVGPRSGLAVH